MVNPDHENDRMADTLEKTSLQLVPVEEQEKKRIIFPDHENDGHSGRN